MATILFNSILAAAALAQTNWQKTTGDISVCTQKQLTDWQFVRSNSLGVKGLDPVAEKKCGIFDCGIGLYSADHWHPIDGSKQTLCGRLHSYGFYDGGGDEADWNLNIVPSSEYVHLIFGALSVADEVDPKDCHPGSNNCLQAEITPDENLYSYSHFPAEPTAWQHDPFSAPFAGWSPLWRSDLEGKTVCTYGPWVYDDAHDNRPEIHPAELVWWSDQEPPDVSSWHLMLLQDDSNRFDRVEDYSDVPPGLARPGWWFPWSEVPRHGEFNVAWEVDLSQRGPVTFSIWEELSQAVRTREDDYSRADADDGKNHAIEYNGRIILRAFERQTEDDNVGVTFNEVCRNNENTRLQGYIRIASRIGLNDRGGEGFHVLEVAKDWPWPDPEPGESWALQLLTPVELSALLGQHPPFFKVRKPSAIPSSLRSTEVNGRRRLVGEVRMEYAGPYGTSVVRRSVSPAVSLSPVIPAPRVSLSTPDPSAWKAMVMAAGGQPKTNAAPAQLLRITKWHVEVQARYAAARRGRASREDESPFAKELNEIIQKGPAARAQQLFGKSQPFKTEWAFQARNLTTGDTISVRRGSTGSPNEIWVDMGPRVAGDGSINVTFPTLPKDAILELVISVKMIDSLGGEGTTKAVIWSHLLSGVGGVVPGAIAAACDIGECSSADLALVASLSLPAEDRRLVTKLRARRARLVYTMALRAGQDGYVTLGEFRRIVTAVKQLAAND